MNWNLEFFTSLGQAQGMPEKQLGVLKALDVAKTQLYHFTAILIAGMGFFTDAYDLFCVSLVTKLLGRIYYFNPLSDKPGSLPPHVAGAVNGAALCGTLAGQLFFGWLGDKLGRKTVYGITLIMMTLCSIGSGLSFGNKATGVMTTLCFFRWSYNYICMLTNSIFDMLLLWLVKFKPDIYWYASFSD